ncbi:hypothetical protein [Mesorhizobium sp. URHB0026]
MKHVLRSDSSRPEDGAKAAKGVLNTRSALSGLSLKDIIGIIFSLCALAVSLTSLYLGTLRRTDDLRVIVTSGPLVDIDRHQDNGATNELSDFMSVTGKTTFVLVNSGNRSIAITAVALVIIQPYSSDPSDRPRECNDGGGAGETVLRYDIAPFAIKGPDVAAQASEFSVDRTTSDFESDDVKFSADRTAHVHISLQNQSRKEYSARFCMLFQIASPNSDEGFKTAAVELFDVNFMNKDGAWGTVSDYKMFQKSYLLFHHSGSILFP